MPFPGRIFADDEELGKKDDEYRPSANGTLPVTPISWTAWKLSPRMRRRRYVALAFTVACLYLFFRNMPTGLLPVSQRVDNRVPGQTIGGTRLSDYTRLPSTKDGKTSLGERTRESPPKPGEKGEKKDNHYYDGEVVYPYLAASLQAVSRTMSYGSYSKTVLFMAANPQSASRMIPLACEMHRWNRNMVHFVYMARDDLTIDELKLLNGIGAECDIFWHGESSDCNAIANTHGSRCSTQFLALELGRADGTGGRCGSKAYIDVHAPTDIYNG